LAAGKLEIAEQMIGKVLQFSPKSIFAHFQFARIKLAEGDIAEAKKVIELEPHPVWKNIGLGMIACAEDNKTVGLSIADKLIEQREIFNAAEIYYLCGDTEKVFELLQQAAVDRDPALTEMKLSWAMTPLRKDPRWIEILKLMGLPV
jgi:tetratricopeptide (TPR) repeat protein